MTQKKIAIIRRPPGPALQRLVDTLSPYGELLINPTEATLDDGGLIALMRDADVALITSLDTLSGAVMEACPKLRLLVNIGVGVNGIDLETAKRCGVTVTNTPGANSNAVADHAWGLLIGAARRLVAADQFVRSGAWTPANRMGFGSGLDVSGKTLGLLGFGQIGQAVARRALGFDMPVLYQTRSRVSGEIESALKATHVPLDALLTQSDYLVLTVPYTTETHHIIAAPQLALMKKSAVIVNVARGGVIDESALVVALTDRTIAAAALDCMENEPQVHPQLLAAPHVMFSPHSAGATSGTHQAMIALAVKNLVIGLSGHTPPNRV